MQVNVDNFVRAETDRMFADIQRAAGGINTFRHNREPAPVDQQTVIRMNRDTLYSFAIVDITEGATLQLPDSGDRYLSAMVVDQDHLIDEIFHDVGSYRLTPDRFATPYVLVGVRILVDPTDPADIAEVARLQDALAVDAASSNTFVYPEYDGAGMDATRNALLSLAKGIHDFDHTFGARSQIDPVRHLIGTAAGWGGLPTAEASYIGVNPSTTDPVQTLTMRDVPVDAFWSVSVYNARGFFEPNEHDRYTVNSVTGVADSDGSITVRFVTDGSVDQPNTIPVPHGWNFLVRLYRPHREAIDGTWQLPELKPIG
ncbi:DUF1254 domain-containing protein [Rhodococcoides yunnanense]|uniref:DUF1254 domain-containing protein n=1 Tax=Rhodococcoides yunnanense TaxID=278209 RepID=UPI0009343E6E|nr:DUF1254 domain-containing protein [Rhodococcus yunnanensis]